MHEIITEVCNVISTVGFPIGVSVYLLIRDSQLIKEMTAAISNNTKSSEALNKSMNDLKDALLYKERN